MKEEVSDIRVAICGLPKSGKTQLANKLHGYSLTRKRDGKSVRIQTEKGLLGSPIFQHNDIALFTFSLQPGRNYYDDQIVHRWRSLKASIWELYPEYLSKICLVGTKLDFITLPDYAYIPALRYIIPFWVKTAYVSTSTVTGAGIDELASTIVDLMFPLPPAKSRRTRWNIMPWLGNRVLDLIASLFSLKIPANVNEETADTLELVDDNAVNALLTNEPPKHPPARIITPTLIAKALNPLERANTHFARSHLNIPIPQPRYPHLKHWYVMDYIQGRTVADCWDSLGFFTQFRIACTLRGYISQMRLLTRAFAGSVEGGHITGFNFAIGLYHGPYGTARRFRQWVEAFTFNGWCETFQSWAVARMDGRAPPGPDYPPPAPPAFKEDRWEPLVFTHGDLSLHNLVLSDDGVLWMIDLGSSGFYPSWMEPLGIFRYQDFPESWNRLRWLVAGSRPVECDSWVYIVGTFEFSSVEPREEEWP